MSIFINVNGNLKEKYNSKRKNILRKEFLIQIRSIQLMIGQRKIGII